MVYQWSRNSRVTILVPILFSLTFLFVIACGASAQPGAVPDQAPAAEATAIPTSPPQAKAEVEPKARAEEGVASVSAIPADWPITQATAAKFAGGPGAVYAGRLEDLVGPAPSIELGDADGNVPLDALEKHKFIYESDHYRKVLEQARLEDTTPMVYAGEKITLQIVCINRSVTACKLREEYFIPNVAKRTNGLVEVQLVGYPELGIAGPDMLTLIEDGTIGFGEVYGGYVAGDLPALEIQYLWGLYPDHETFYKATVAALEETDRMISERTGGGVVVLHNWYTGQDQFFYTKKPVRTREDFIGMKTRSHGTALSDWIDGMGATPQFVAFAEVYTALERGILDAGVTGADAAYGQRWYEVTDYMVGPLITMVAAHYVMNQEVWDRLPPDIQQILLEEAARDELEALRIASIQNLYGVPKLQATGELEYIEFSPELKEYMLNEVTMKRVIPNWVQRAGGPDSEPARLFNEKVSDIVGVKINPDGTVSKLEK